MVVGRVRRVLKKGLSIALAAAIMATSAPQLSVTALAQEEAASDVTRPDDEDEGQPQKGTSENRDSENRETEDRDPAQDNEAEKDSTEEDAQNEGGGVKSPEETTEDNVEDPDQTEDGTDDDSTENADNGKDDDKESGGDEEDKPVVKRKKTSANKAAASEEDEAEGTLIYEWDFDSKSVGDKSDDGGKSGTVAELGTGNKAMEYEVALKDGTSWEEAFATSYALPSAYETPVTEKLTMSFDIYFPDENGDSEVTEDSVSDFGTMKAQLVLNNGDNWDWLAADSYPEITAEKLTVSDIEGYSKVSISTDITGNKEENNAWDFTSLTSLRAVTIKLVGDISTYEGKLYIDNVVLKDTSTQTEEPDPGPNLPEEPSEGEIFFSQNFDDVEKLEDAVDVAGSEGLKDEGGEITASLVELETDTGNKAIKFPVDLTNSTGWKDIFKVQMNLPTEFDKKLDETDGKVVMSYDIYFPADSVKDDFGTMTALPGLKSGESWTWVTSKNGVDISNSNANSGIDGYVKLHVDVDMKEFKTWDAAAEKDVDFAFSDIIPIRAVIPCLAGNTSTYKGDLYLDNVTVRAVGIAGDGGEEDPPTVSKELIYENDFNELENLTGVLSENVSGRTPALAELASGNQAVKYTVDQLPGTGWDDVFKAQFNLSQPYDKKISSKVVMSYDIYFPAASVVAESFDMFKAQATIACGSAWEWATQKSWPEIKAAELQDDADVPGFKKAHVEIDMKDFQAWDDDLNDNKAYPFEDITPIQAVIPCFAGSGSTYEGDLYLDNLEVWAVNETEEIPDVVDDLVLDLDVSAWKVGEAYQYTGTTQLANKTVGGKKLLAATVDFSKDANQGWSEPKFDYTHAEVVPSLKGYNAFVADVYYKPPNRKAGSFGHKLFAKSPTTSKETINDDTALPAGEPVEIDGLEGYYKAEFVLEKKFEGDFQNLTFSIVGKNTDYAGDVYFDNMRFTQLSKPDIYVDTTILPQKGPGIQVVDGGRSIQTASGQKVAIAENVALVDAEAIDATKNLYAYLKAVGESDSVIFGHQNDTHKKAGSLGEDFSSSDTKDITGSIAGVVGIDTLSLTGNEASTWNTPETERIAAVAQITKEAAGEGAIVTLSAHMPNFALIDERVKNFGEADGTETDSEKVGYWLVNGEKQYNFSGYTPGTLSGNVVQRIMPGQDLNYLYTDYLDMIADYAKAVEGDGVTILFRPFHENTGSWFWWGAALCDEQAYINLFRYTVDYLKETKGVHNMLYVYGPGSEASSVVEYSARYPGDAYVDMIGYDLYHQMPTQASEPGYLASIKKQNTILRDFAGTHGKLYAITETGVADKDSSGGDIALKRSGNEVPDWYMQLLDEISEDGGISYFLVWANFSENGSFYLPYVIEKKENGILHGHEMLDEFIKFYNDGRSVFATDMNSGYAEVSGVINTTQKTQVSGYFIAPQSGDRILPSKGNTGRTRIAAKVSGVDPAAEGVSVEFVVSTEFDEVVLAAEYNEQAAAWEAYLKDGMLVDLGEAVGTITLRVNEEKASKIIASIIARFNMVEQEQNDMVPDGFEGYDGKSEQLALIWAAEKESGSEITLTLTDEEEKVFGGDYGLQMDITLSGASAWVGAKKNFVADWSAGNALEFYTIPEKYGQKVVVQVQCGGNIFEVYLQEFAEYTANAESAIPVKVTVPFDAFVGRDNKDAKFDPQTIESIGLYCNAIAKEDVTFPLQTTICYDEFRVVTTDKTEVEIEATVKEGIWFKDIPDQVYTGKAVKPEVLVYDDAKQLTLKTDYTVTYKNNTKAGQADIIIKGKGNYAETIEGHFNILPKQVGDLTITAPDYLIFNNKEQKIAVTVKDGNKKLSTKNDYTQTITFIPETAAQDGEEVEETVVEKAKEAGTYNIRIEMKGNYAGVVTMPCRMVEGKELLSKAKVTLPSNSLDYKDGAAVEFEDPSKIIVKLSGKVIPQKAEDGVTDNYTVSYDDNYEVGTAKVLIRAGENSKYVGSCSKTFSIKGMPFSTKTVEITGFQTKFPYTGKYIRQNVEVKDKASGNVLERNVDYRITYVNNLNAGKATMTVTGLKKYSGTIKMNFTIDKVALTTDMVQQKEMTVRQNRAGVTPDVEILYEGKTLMKDVDYKLTYTNNKNTTTETKKAYINIAGKGNFKGSLGKAVELTITPKSWDSGEITVEVSDMKYSKSKAKYTPNPIVYDNGKKLTKNKDYMVAYESNLKTDITEFTEDGALAVTGHTAYVIITLTGPDYTVTNAETPAVEEGTESADGNKETFAFRIIDKLISKAKVSVKSDRVQSFSQYGTRPGKEDLTVTYENVPVTDEEYDIISYSKNDRKGKATLVIQGKGQYGGTKNVIFTIQARGMKANLADSVKEVMETVMEAFGF